MEKASPAELQRRLVYSLLRPVARFSRLFRMPLKSVEELCRLACYEAARRGGAPQHELARALGRSLRTIGAIEKRSREDFLAPEREVELGRRVEEAFDAGEATLEEAAARIGEPLESFRPVAEGLVATGRLEKLADGRLRLDRRFRSLVRGDLQARVDGLNHQLDVIGQAMRARFLTPKGRGTARTLSFVASEEEMDKLTAELVRLFRAHCTEAEENTLDSGDAYRRYGVTFALAPLEDPDA